MNKYRAWDEENKEMRDVRAIWFNDDNKTIGSIVYPENDTVETLFNDFILMQSTGLKDKNGVESWEGNYLTREGGWTFFIDWLDEYGCLMAVPVNPIQRINWEPVPIKRMLERGFVNNGNIHANPELLKEVE